MNWKSLYRPPRLEDWQGRPDAPAGSFFFQIVKALDLREPPASTPRGFVLLGFSCDEGIRRNLGRTGAANGPQALRQAFAKLPVQAPQLIFYDAGDMVCPQQDLENAQQALSVAIEMILQRGLTPIVIGGGHELAWGHYQGIEKQLGSRSLGIVNFDAHFDMRPLLPGQQGSSGTPFLQIANAHESSHRKFDYHCVGIQRTGNTQSLFDTAKQYNTHVLMAEELYQSPLEKSAAFIQQVIDHNERIYLSLCLDVFAAPYAPGVSAPQTFGVTPWQIIPLVRQLAASGKVISYDIAELSPPYDIDQRTAKLAAHFVYEMIHYHQL